MARKSIQVFRQMARLAAAGLAWSLLSLCSSVSHAQTEQKAASTAQAADYQRARYSELHFQPAIAQAEDKQCLACHGEVLQPSTRAQSPAGVKASQTKAWYQQLATYDGEQDTFHRRHLVTPLAKSLMNLKCNTCHEGSDPRDKNPQSSATAQREGGFRLRKNVIPETTCLKCHGQMNWKVMGLPSPWHESKTMFQNNCLMCHAAIRTNRHQVSYLKADAIEAAGEANADACYGCHGGRAWYRSHYPYPRHPWPGMAEEIPNWAKGRPTLSEARFQIAVPAKTQTPTQTQTQATGAVQGGQK